MALQFTQEEVETALRDIIEHGDIREISINTGIGEKYLSSQLNPHDERKSYAYGFLQIQCALDRVDTNRGDEFFEQVQRFRDLSKLREIKDLCSKTEASKLVTENAEFLCSQIKDKPLPEQLSELDDVIRQAQKLKEALTEEHLNAKKEEDK